MGSGMGTSTFRTVGVKIFRFDACSKAVFVLGVAALKLLFNPALGVVETKGL